MSLRMLNRMKRVVERKRFKCGLIPTGRDPVLKVSYKVLHERTLRAIKKEDIPCQA